MNILAARKVLLSGEMRIQYMHIEMHRYIHNILVLFNKKYFSLIIRYVDTFYCCISVCHSCGFILCFVQNIHTYEKNCNRSSNTRSNLLRLDYD